MNEIDSILIALNQLSDTHQEFKFKIHPVGDNKFYLSWENQEFGYQTSISKYSSSFIHFLKDLIKDSSKLYPYDKPDPSSLTANKLEDKINVIANNGDSLSSVCIYINTDHGLDCVRRIILDTDLKEGDKFFEKTARFKKPFIILDYMQQK